MSDDLIRRSDAIKAVNKAKAEGMTECPTYYLGIVPTIEPKRGKWIGYNADKEDWLRNDGTPIFLVCDKCYATVVSNASAHWNFCPNCGADMREREGE